MRESPNLFPYLQNKDACFSCPAVGDQLCDIIKFDDLNSALIFYLECVIFQIIFLPQDVVKIENTCTIQGTTTATNALKNAGAMFPETIPEIIAPAASAQAPYSFWSGEK